MTRLGSSVLRFDSVTSTNDVARQMAASGVEEGVAIVAREQTAGRGTKGREWSSPAGEGLYLSLVLRPAMKASDSTILTLAAAVGVAETLSDFGAAPDIKWPNDVLLGSLKVCGILVESASEGARLAYAVLGIGVNLRQREFPVDVAGAATSLAIETGRVVNPEEFLLPLLSHLDRWYHAALTTPSEVLDRYRQLSSYTRGCAVRATVAERDGSLSIEGVTRGVTATGALMIETADGQIKLLSSGEVHRIRPANLSGEHV